MEKRVLISMVDYVLEKNKLGLPYLTAMDSCVNYAKFLSIPLTEEILDEIFETISKSRIIYVLQNCETVEDLLKLPQTNDIVLSEKLITKYQI